MHDYAIFGHDRAAVGRWLGFAAILIAGGISQMLTYAFTLTGIQAFTKATITTGIIYLFLHWLFNKYAWKIPILKLPDLNGTWNINGKTLDEEGNIIYKWHGTVGIEQTWKQLLIHLQTSQSQSNSYTATLSKRHGPTGGWLLSYSYKNEPEVTVSHELNPHSGYCEIELDIKLTNGNASYFNSRGRRTFGVMKLERKQDD